MKGKIIVVKNAVLMFLVATIMARYPYVLSFDIVQITPLGRRTLVVKGVVELQRGSEGWTGPENFYWFNLWWQSGEAADRVLSESRGLIQLHAINWILIEEKENSDVLEFTAVITVFPSASPPWRKGW